LFISLRALDTKICLKKMNGSCFGSSRFARGIVCIVGVCHLSEKWFIMREFEVFLSSLCFYYYYAIFVFVPTYMYVVKFMVTDLILIYSPWLPVNPVCIGPYILVLYCVIQYPILFGRGICKNTIQETKNFPSR
jgi:hypothetical protein